MKIRTAATAALTLAATLTLAGCATGAGQGPMPGMDHGASAPPSMPTKPTSCSRR